MSIGKLMFQRKLIAMNYSC